MKKGPIMVRPQNTDVSYSAYMVRYRTWYIPYRIPYLPRVGCNTWMQSPQRDSNTAQDMSLCPCHQTQGVRPWILLDEIRTVAYVLV